jgi:7TMR-DISM extracellular protein 2
MGKALPHIVAAFLSLLSCLVSGQPIFVFDTLQEEYHLNDHLWVWRDTSGVAAWEEVASPGAIDHFQPYSEAKPLAGIKDVYWGKLHLVNNLREENLVKDWILWIGEGSYIDVYIIGAEGNLRSHLKTGELVPAKDKTLTTGNRLERIAFSMKPGDTVTLLVRLQLINKRTPSFKMRLVREDFYHTWRFVSETRRDWMFLRFLFTMFGFHLLLYLMTRDRAFLYQSLFLGCLFVFCSTFSLICRMLLSSRTTSGGSFIFPILRN